MQGLTIHIASEGYVAPGTNTGSNPLAQGSDYRLGPALDIFTLKFTPEVGFIDSDQHFVDQVNPYLTSVSSDSLSVVMAQGDDAMGPVDLRLRIGGVSYKVSYTTAARIKGPNTSRVRWIASQGLGFVKDRGDFRYFRNSPGV